MERVGLFKQKEKFTIRAHHIGEYEDFAKEYNKEIKIKPWDLKHTDIEVAMDFIHKFVVKDIEGWKKARFYFSELTNFSDFLDSENRLRYITDVVGDSDEDAKNVISKRSQVFYEFLRLSIKDKNTKIPLIITPDSFCKSCAIGSHCSERPLKTVFKKDDKDYVFRRSLKEVLKNKGWFLYFTPKELFDENFYATVYENIKTQGNSDWL